MQHVSDGSWMKKEDFSWEKSSERVRLIGLEPTRIATPDPKSGASTNFATSAKDVTKLVQTERKSKFICEFLSCSLISTKKCDDISKFAEVVVT